MASLQWPLLSLFSLLFLRHTDATVLTFINNCRYTIWPSTLSASAAAALPSTGFELPSSSITTMAAPRAWSGRVWARTSCSAGASGKFVCATGDCGSGELACNGAGGKPPATLVEFTLNGAEGKDFYDTSLVDGFNVPMSITPRGGSGCNGTACTVDINAGRCPVALQVKEEGGGGVIGCASACEVFGTDEYCCRGAFGGPATCKPTEFSMVFKANCPQAYSYAYDDATSTFTFIGSDYDIVFCP